MTEEEIELFRQQLESSINYLEFGSGESTKLAVTMPNIRSIVSVESSPEFVKDQLLILDKVVQACQTQRLRFLIIDIGETTEWGYPKTSSKKSSWPEYSQGPFKQNARYDLILIDGRFRVACAIQSIFNSDADTKILIHDFWPRKEYHLLLEFLDVEKRVDSLAVFTVKSDVDLVRAKRVLRKFRYFPGDKDEFSVFKERLSGRIKTLLNR